ncbi:P-II family nitrogen regulator, partial [Achromobacter sp.]|uniref:P-II family nitrogen regulator n=1 Tax=Achromobacter sp. TaxID=134375 RepID=UPI003D01828C
MVASACYALLRTKLRPRCGASRTTTVPIRTTFAPFPGIAGPDQHGMDIALTTERATKRGNAMKLIIAIIKPFKLDEVRVALS